MGSRAPLGPLASPGQARLVPQGFQARLGHQDSRGCGGSRGVEGTRASGDPQGLLAFLGPLALLSLENQALREYQGPLDLEGSRGHRGNLGPQGIKALRGTRGWASQGCPGPQGRGVPPDHLVSLAQLAWVDQAWMGFLGPLETRVSLGPLGYPGPGGSQELWAPKGPLE